MGGGGGGAVYALPLNKKQQYQGNSAAAASFILYKKEYCAPCTVHTGDPHCEKDQMEVSKGMRDADHNCCKKKSAGSTG